MANRIKTRGSRTRKPRAVRSRRAKSKYTIELRPTKDAADWARQIGMNEQQAEDALEDARTAVIEAAWEEAADRYRPELETALRELLRAKDEVFAAVSALRRWSPPLAAAMWRYTQAECDQDGFEHMRRVSARESTANARH